MVSLEQPAQHGERHSRIGHFDGRDRIERRYAIRQPRRMAIENPERLRMLQREWAYQENIK